MRQLSRLLALIASIMLIRAAARAGPPFVTDDPGTLPYRSGESYLFAAGSHASGGTTLDAAPGIEANYALFPNSFFHLVAPLSLNKQSGVPASYGPGDTELGFKYRFVSQTPGRPDIAIFPFLELPTGNRSRGLGSGEVQVFLPVWLQKDYGRWTSYGGGGYWINPGAGNRNWWFSGILLQRQVTDRFYLGGEVFHQTPDVVGGTASTAFNVGGGITVHDPYQVIFSAGRNLTHVESNQLSFYLAFYTTFR